ncbi:MAG TPA: type I restriction enzyme HsdR N-terminal domain-containing protein [Flavisolibacter sp.]|nr:type I restriction enzyme HsdR N-terminal domain-containing protein [Flavisolibacter sp.]
MIVVQFPEPKFRLKKEGEKAFVFDEIRKRWLLLTEEEWVRQNFVAYLQKELHYPAALIAIEKGLLLNGLKKRFDILVYDAAHKPWLMVECKAPSVALSEEVLQQALRYNQSVPVDYIIITNGEKTMGWEKSGSSLKLINALPRLS